MGVIGARISAGTPRVYAPRRVIYSPVYIAAVRVICNVALPMRCHS